MIKNGLYVRWFQKTDITLVDYSWFYLPGYPSRVIGACIMTAIEFEKNIRGRKSAPPMHFPLQR